LEFFERVSGARLHTTIFRFGGIQAEINNELFIDMYNFIFMFGKRLNEMEELLTKSRI
jgi:NADH:ubiquinone oxidoreductase subunit D